MARPRKQRIYWKNGRAYGDFRDYAKWGGRQEALASPGSRAATGNANEAMRLCAARLEALDELKRVHPDGLPNDVDVLEQIAGFVGYHLVCLEKRRKRGRLLSPSSLRAHRRHLIHALRFLHGRGKLLLKDITTADVRAWLADLEATPPPLLAARVGGRTGPLTDNTRAKYLFSLNALLRRAWREERIRENPVDRLDPDERPRACDTVTPFLEVGEAALILEVARRRAHWGRSRTQHYVRLAVHLLTGGRGSEVLGLEKADLDFVENRIWIRPNETRPNVNKSRGTARVVPMWPQLREILEDYLAGPHAPTGPTVFDRIDCGKWLDRIADSLDWPRERLRRRVFRVTYASARIQTLDGGAPVSDWTVQQEMGHGSLQMLKKVYVRIGSVRQRREYVEYRWDEWSPTYLPLFLNATGLPRRWLDVLEALPGTGATTKEWLNAAAMPVGTFYYIRKQLAARGLIIRVGEGRGSRFYRAGAEATGTAPKRRLALAS